MLEKRAQINAAVRHGLENESVLNGPALKTDRYLIAELNLDTPFVERRRN